jgi:hydrogenase maturation factor
MLLEPDLEVGDWVLVTSGTVVRRLDPDQAAEMSAAIRFLYGPAESETVDAAVGGAAAVI